MTFARVTCQRSAAHATRGNLRGREARLRNAAQEPLSRLAPARPHTARTECSTLAIARTRPDAATIPLRGSPSPSSSGGRSRGATALGSGCRTVIAQSCERAPPQGRTEQGAESHRTLDRPAERARPRQGPVEGAESTGRVARQPPLGAVFSTLALAGRSSQCGQGQRGEEEAIGSEGCAPSRPRRLWPRETRPQRRSDRRRTAAAAGRRTEERAWKVTHPYGWQGCFSQRNR